MSATSWVAAAAAALLLGLLLMLAGRLLRRSRGLGGGRTVSLDHVTLTSRRLGLTGRPDRLVRAGGPVIPEEWKSARRLRPWRRAQLGVYFLLIEDQFGVRPPHGFIVSGDGTRHRVENTEELRAWVLGLAAQIRVAKAGWPRRSRSSPNPASAVRAACAGSAARPRRGRQGRQCGGIEHLKQLVDRIAEVRGVEARGWRP